MNNDRNWQRRLITTFILSIALSLWLIVDATAQPANKQSIGGSNIAADPSQFFEGTAALDDGAGRDHYNRVAGLRWENQLGDWVDAAGFPLGNKGFASADIAHINTSERVRWDLLSLVQHWRLGSYPNQGVILRLGGRPSSLRFRSREYSVADQTPQLVIETTTETYELPALADTFIDQSTFQGFGDSATLDISNTRSVLLRFNLSAIPETAEMTAASLELTAYWSNGPSTVQVFRLAQSHHELPVTVEQGIAAHYHLDIGIDADPDVVFFADFNTQDWRGSWSRDDHPETVERLDADPALNFSVFEGAALRVTIPADESKGMDVGYDFLSQSGSEPEEIYFRYYLRFAPDWDPRDGGKLPGLAGRYWVAGWGGRPTDGTNGWSARGQFQRAIPAGNPLSHRIGIGSYVYHPDADGGVGEINLWQKNYLGYFERDRWYSLEQYIKLNTPGQNDGVIRAWVDGQLAYERVDWRWRDTDALKIEELWMNVYHGGTRPVLETVHLYIDNVVLATRYIGPAGGERPNHIFDNGFER